MTTAISLESPRPRRRARGITLAVLVGVVVALSAPTAAQAVQVKSHYYDNYFYSAATCKARGQAVDEDPTRLDHIPLLPRQWRQEVVDGCIH